MLFGKGDRHVTAEMLYVEAIEANIKLSLATVYNTLHQFTGAGLLRWIAVYASKSYFDTNCSAHHHFFIEGKDVLLDIVNGSLVDKIPVPPDGYEIARVDVVVRVRPKRGCRATILARNF
jgi:Fur family transcriptional regulator, iron response regulator